MLDKRKRRPRTLGNVIGKVLVAEVWSDFNIGLYAAGGTVASWMYGVTEGRNLDWSVPRVTGALVGGSPSCVEGAGQELGAQKEEVVMDCRKEVSA